MSTESIVEVVAAVGSLLLSLIVVAIKENRK